MGTRCFWTWCNPRYNAAADGTGKHSCYTGSWTDSALPRDPLTWEVAFKYIFSNIKWLLHDSKYHDSWFKTLLQCLYPWDSHQKPAESGWLYGKYSLSQTRHDTLLWGNVQPPTLFQHTRVTVILELLPFYLGIFPMLPMEILLGCERQHLRHSAHLILTGSTPANKLHGIKGFYGLIQVCVYPCACVCTFCSSVTYCATMKDESVVKLSATAAMCEYILSTSLEHSRYTSLSGPSNKKKTTIDVNSITYWRFHIHPQTHTDLQGGFSCLVAAAPASLMLLKDGQVCVYAGTNYPTVPVRKQEMWKKTNFHPY